MIDISFDDKKRKGIYSGKYFDEVKEFFSVKNDAAKFSRNRFMPSRKYAITTTGRFDSCLLGEIFKYLEKNTEIKLDSVRVDKALLKEVSPSKYDWKNNSNFSLDEYPLNLKLREYQKNIVDKCMDLGRGTVLLATAGGKTLVMASLLSKIFTLNKDFKACLIVPNRGLVEQTYNDFIDYKVPFTFSKWTGDDELLLSQNVIICNTSILQSKKSDISWMEYVDVLVVDECHHLKKSNEITKIIETCKTPHKFGFTGTLPEDKLDQWSIIGKIGPVIYQKKSYELRKEKYVVPAIVQVVELVYKTKPLITFSNNLATENYKNEINFLKNNTFRNNSIKKITKNSNNNILILVDYLDHGDALNNLLSSELKDKEVFYIKGEVEVSDRERIKKIMEYKNNVVCIAISKIFSTGINIKNLHYIVFAGGGKSKIKVLQSIGRGLRLHENKSTLYIIDIADQLYYGIKHQQKREEFYKQEKISMQTIKIYES
jgi:superfamily II DNA or RNA helicase